MTATITVALLLAILLLDSGSFHGVSAYRGLLLPPTSRPRGSARGQRIATTTTRGPLSLSSASSSSSTPPDSASTAPANKKTNNNKATKKQSNRPKQQQQQQPRRNIQSNHRNNAFQASKLLNQQIIKCEDAKCVLQVLQDTATALTAVAAGGTMNTVNFSTSIHRLARHSTQDRTARATTLQDPRTALLLAGLAEALDDPVTFKFGTREWSNIGWALAKLRLSPPAQAMSLSSSGSENGTSQLTTSAVAVRKAVMQAAATRRETGQAASAATWIPALSQTAGVILDHIRCQVLEQEMAEGPKKPFRMQEYANLLWAWATAGRADPIVFGTVIRSLMKQQRLIFESPDDDSEPFPQEWSNSVWAFATAQVYNGHEELLDFVAELMQRDAGFVDRYKPQELSNTVWAIATLLSNQATPLTQSEEQSALVILRQCAKSLIRRVSAFKTQELSNTIWGLATLGFGQKPLEDLGYNNYVVLTSQELASDRALLDGTVDAITRAAMPLLRRFRSQELNNMAWALARLEDQNQKSEGVEAVLRGIGMQLCDPKRQATSQDISMVLWSLATLGFLDDEMYRGIAAQGTRQQASGFKPQELSNTVWALATAEVNVGEVDAFDTSLVPPPQRPKVRDPATACFGIAAQQLMQRPYEFKPQEIKDVLWSFSKVGIRHPSLFKSMAEHLIGREDDPSDNGRGLAEFSPQGIGNMAWAFARQAQLAEDVPNRIKGSAITYSNGRLAVYTASYFDVGEVIIQRLFAEVAKTDLLVHGQLSKLKPQDLANTAWAFAVLGLRPPEFMDEARSQLEARTSACNRGTRNAMTYFKGQELANLLWTLATLNCPPKEVLESLSLYLQRLCSDGNGKVTTEHIAKFLKRQELANIAWSCAVFGMYPPELMRLLYLGLVGDNHDPAYMTQVFGDSGLQPQEIMTLIYVQCAMDRQGCNSQGLTLPDSFPEGWKQSSGRQSGSNSLSDTDLALNLSTSKTQQAVSAAFGRIGFAHVEEHTISMEELARDYNVNVPSTPMEILSIDIANLEDRIAIEFDGPAHFVSRIDSVTDEGGFTRVINGRKEYQFGWKGDRQEINGPTALKQRLLANLGWKTVNLPFWEWYALGNDAVAEEEYCRALLERVTTTS